MPRDYRPISSTTTRWFVPRSHVLAEWGHVDVLVNNGRYIGPGHMDHIVDTPVQVLRDHLRARTLAAVVVEEMVPVVDDRTRARYSPPPQALPSHLRPGTASPQALAPGGVASGPSTASRHPLRGGSHRSIRGFGQRQPGFIATERMQQDMAAFGFDASTGAPAAVVGKVCRWLLESPDAVARNGTNIEAQDLCRELQLLPGWP